METAQGQRCTLRQFFRTLWNLGAGGLRSARLVEIMMQCRGLSQEQVKKALVRLEKLGYVEVAWQDEFITKLVTISKGRDNKEKSWKSVPKSEI